MWVHYRTARVCDSGKPDGFPVSVHQSQAENADAKQRHCSRFWDIGDTAVASTTSATTTSTTSVATAICNATNATSDATARNDGITCNKIIPANIVCAGFATQRMVILPLLRAILAKSGCGG